MSARWDRRFLSLARLVASWSKDPSTQTGAVIVRPDRSVSSVGFNGFPQGMPDLPELYAGEYFSSRVVHCEVNALIFCREPVLGYTLYTWPSASCDRCCVQMLQAGIARFVFPRLSAGALLSRWGASIEKTKTYIGECGASWDEMEGW